MSSERPHRLITPALTGEVEGFETPQTLPPLHIEFFVSRDLEDSSTGTADNNDSNNEEDTNNGNEDDK